MSEPNVPVVVLVLLVNVSQYSPNSFVSMYTDWYVSVGSAGQGNEQTILRGCWELQICEAVPAEPRWPPQWWEGKICTKINNSHSLHS